MERRGFDMIFEDFWRFCARSKPSSEEFFNFLGPLRVVTILDEALAFADFLLLFLVRELNIVANKSLRLSTGGCGKPISPNTSNPKER
jgi:hypothetical protein